MENRSYQESLHAFDLEGRVDLVGMGVDLGVVVDEASQGELTGMYVERHLVESGRDECREPKMLDEIHISEREKLTHPSSYS